MAPLPPSPPESVGGTAAVSRATERHLAARIGGFALHSQQDSREIAARARRGWREGFERQVDPDGVLPEEERLRRAECARKSYMMQLALKSAKARRVRASRRQNGDADG